MGHDYEYSMVITTTRDNESAKKLAGALLEARLAACVQFLPAESMYIWQGAICIDNETVLFIKTKTALLDKLTVTIKENHSYEIPEIIQLPITDGSPDYLKWIGSLV